MADPARRNLGGLIAVATTGLFLTACGEISQDAVKPFAANGEAQPHAGALYKGDKALYEKTLADRAQTQDEYRTLDEATR